MISLRLRMIAAFTAVALLASVGASGLAYVLVRRATLQRAQETALTSIREVVARIVPAKLPPDSTEVLLPPLKVGLEAADDRFKAFTAVTALQDGYTVTPSPRQPLPPPGALDVPVTQEFAQAAVRQLVYQRVISHGRPYLLVGGSVATDVDWADLTRARPPLFFVSVSLEREAAVLRSFTQAILVADGLALVVALGLALLATRGVLRPVRSLGRAARALGEGELDTRVPVRGRDELADLARTFNRTAEALERMVTELRAKDAASRRFVADVSHELRTPLTSMVAATDILSEESAASETGGTAARLVATETRRLGRLVERLLEISRFDAGAAALVLDDVVVAEAVEACLGTRGWQGRVEVDGPDDLVVRLDPRRFDVIVANLVGNALKHGRPPVRLTFDRAVREGRTGLQLTVADDGPGVPEELLDAVFERFVKAEAARSRSDGSGLGLSIARENALLHEGTLEVASGGPGAVFTLWLPSAPDHEETT